jgi:hypothetical protein
MKLAWPLMALIFALSGCANKPWVWGYAPVPGDRRDIARIEVDFRACIARYDPAGLSDFNAKLGYPSQGHSGKDEVRACMEKDGWSKEPEFLLAP